MNKHLLLVAVVSIVASCSAPENHTKANQEEHVAYEVKYAGALKDIMHKGDITSKFHLAGLADVPHLYALGAMENLKGEIQIFDGNPLNTFVQDSAVVFNKSFDVPVRINNH